MDQRPPLQRSRRWPTQVLASSSENWQKYIVIVLLCKQDCTPSRDYTYKLQIWSETALAAQPSPNKDKHRFPLSSSFSMGIRALGYKPYFIGSHQRLEQSKKNILCKKAEK